MVAVAAAVVVVASASVARASVFPFARYACSAPYFRLCRGYRRHHHPRHRLAWRVDLIPVTNWTLDVRLCMRPVTNLSLEKRLHKPYAPAREAW